MVESTLKYQYCKSLFSQSVDCAGTEVLLVYNTNTDSIKISSRYKGNGRRTMRTNPKCSQYLGIHVAEGVLSKLFNGVVRMPNNHRGYDFICGRGFKIDVKSACARYGARGNGRYTFHIRGNTDADYFLCLAFDNRDDLNPQHLWLIPECDVRGKTDINVSCGSTSKLDEYKVDKMDIVTSQCVLRRGNNDA